MSVWNVFDPDAFSLQTLTAAMINQSFTPSAIGDSGLFESSGVPNLAALIEEIGDTVALVAVKPRNASGQVAELDKAKLHNLSIPHLPQRAAVMADSVQGVREFGSEDTAKTVEGERNKKLAKMRRQIDYTIEYHRLLALQGGYVDVNGATQNAFTLFGSTQQTVDFALNNAATKVRSKCLTVQTSMESQLGGVSYTGIEAWCGATFWDNLITHALVEQTYLNTQMAAALREGLLNTLDFGDIRFKRYRGSSAVGIAAKEAYAYPVGVSGMFLTRFAPAPYMETVNTIGLPYYAKAEEMKFGVGVEMQGQSNPLNICTRPSAVIKLTTP
jgi:major capsid protein E